MHAGGQGFKSPHLHRCLHVVVSHRENQEFQRRGLAVAAILVGLLMLLVASSCGVATERPDKVPLPFSAVSAGWFHSCGILEDGTAVCWGFNESGQAVPPKGVFLQLSAGRHHTCGVLEDDSIACWGRDEYGESTPPMDAFQSVAVGLAHTCGLTIEGEIRCWGANGLGQSDPPTGVFTWVHAGWNHTCGVREHGSIACWGSERIASFPVPEGIFRTVSLGANHGCGLTEENLAVCWGVWAYQPPVPSTKFVSLSGGSPNCGVLEDGSVSCWGLEPYYDYRDEPPIATPVGGVDAFAPVMAELDTGVFAWQDYQGSFWEGEFRSVSIGLSHACGLRLNGSLTCKGQNHHGQASPPQTP